MKNHTLVSIALAVLVAGCSERSSSTTVADGPNAGAAEAPPPSFDGAAPPAREMGGGITGKVIETMDASNYTYVLLEVGEEEIWVAGPQVGIAVGDEVTAAGTMEMIDFASATLERTFERILFAAVLTPAGTDATSATPAVHGAAEPTAEATATEVIAPTEGGATLEEIFLMKDELIGVEVTFRGKVVKYNAGILGKNWLHVQDGTGEAGANDLAITTDATCQVGDIVVVRGVLVADRDFGSGYVYDLIVEDAQVTVE